MHQQNKLRFWIVLFSTMVFLGISGCMATESQQGQTYVYKKSILNTLLLLGIAVTLLVFGIGIIRETLKVKKPRKSKRSSKSGKRTQVEPSSPKSKTGGIVLGAGLSLGGALILLLGVPSSLVQHITISPDKVSMRLSVLWFSSGTREIPFSSITEIEKSEIQVGKRKDETLVLHTIGGTEYIEMGPLEKAAFPKLVEMVKAYQEGGGTDGDNQQVADQSMDPANPNLTNPLANPPVMTDPQIVQNPPNPDPANPELGRQNSMPINKGPLTPPRNATPVDESKLTPVSHIGRLFKGGQAMVKGLGDRGYGLAYILEVYAEGKLKVLYYKAKPGEEQLVDVADARPGNSMYVPKEFGPGTLIDPANPPAPGSKLLGFHAGRWFEVEFVQMSGKLPIIKWPGEPGQNISTPEMARVPPPEGTKPYDGKRYNPPNDDGLTPFDQRGAYAKGKTVYLKEGPVSKPVIVVQLYREQVTKVMDPETQEPFYVLSSELSFTP